MLTLSNKIFYCVQIKIIYKMDKVEINKYMFIWDTFAGSSVTWIAQIKVWNLDLLVATSIILGNSFYLFT